MQTSLDIKNPGLRTLPPGVERYYVKGGGLSVIEVLPEDKIEIVNDEGKQTCEIVVFNSKGKSDLSILNLKENSNANFSKKTISQDEKVKVILVNIFAGINRCDWVAEGIVQALQKIEINMPLVIRLAGTNVEKGNKILKESKINYIEASTLEDAANKAVKALKELEKN